jgi:hypothetical protein
MMKKKNDFKGVDWTSSLSRPGCQDFLKCPSRSGQEFRPYRSPILNASIINQKAKNAKKGA